MKNISSFAYLQSSGLIFFPFCVSYGNGGFHRRSRGNNISQSISKCSFPSQLFTNRSRPPLWEQVTHCRGMHNLPMNCCIFCLVFTFFQRGGEKRTFFFPDKDIFCFWWMKSVCISLETTNKFTLGTGMKPSIHFMWVPSDGKSPSYCPTVLVFKSLKNEVTCNTPGSLGNTLMYRDILTLSNYEFPFVWVAIIFMCLCSWEKKKKTELCRTCIWHTQGSSRARTSDILSSKPHTHPSNNFGD